MLGPDVLVLLSEPLEVADCTVDAAELPGELRAAFCEEETEDELLNRPRITLPDDTVDDEPLEELFIVLCECATYAELLLLVPEHVPKSDWHP